MENASKALLIAGAILLVIAIIAIGMTILGQGQDVVDQTGGQIGALAINAHNQQFGEIYQDAEINGSKMKQIATTALSNNKQSKSNKVTDVTVKVNGEAVSNSNLGAINLGKNYTITAVGYTETGAINSIEAQAEDYKADPVE